MVNRAVRVLQINTADRRGGAAMVAWDLHRSYVQRGMQARMAVGQKSREDPEVVQIPNDAVKPRHVRALCSAARRLQDSRRRGARLLRPALRFLAEPGRMLDIWQGREDFHYPGSKFLLRLFPEVPDLVHAHNLHGEYFDLRVLPALGERLPVVLTLHDAWLLSGNCAHPLGCGRWKTGCRRCPQLVANLAIRSRGTAYNWHRKRTIYAKSRLHVATPCEWLMKQVARSIIAPAVAEARVIPNGVDLSVFRPANRECARAALGIPQDASMLLFTADGIRRNTWKDFSAIRTTFLLVAKRLNGQGVVLVALGEEGPAERVGQAELRFVGYQDERETVARFYQAADLYLHAAKADTFPSTVLEALACGTPVVAMAIGGIPEQVKGLRAAGCGSQGTSCDLNRHEPGEATGVLLPAGDAEGMARSVVALLTNAACRQRLGKNAAADAQQRFDLTRQADAYVTWYRELIQKWNGGRSASQHGAMQRGGYALSNS